MKEAVLLIQRLWTEERVTHHGDFYLTENVTIYGRPERPVPIYIGASGPAATRLAGRIADGCIATSGKAPSLYAETLVPALEDGIAKAGRAESAVDRLIEMKVSFDHDGSRALHDTRFCAALTLSTDEKVSIEDPAEMERRDDELPIERAASRWIVSTDADEHVGRIRQYNDLGFRHLVFHTPGHDHMKFIQLYGEEIIPMLRAL